MATRKAAGDDLGIRPLTARSVLLSTLLGLDPPVQTANRLVVTAKLFGIGENAARVALSRMAAAGDVIAEDGRYRLTGRLLDRQRRQQTGVNPPSTPDWSGAWHVALVTAARRPAAERGELRTRMAGGRFAEWREGVWTRPANLDRPELHGAIGAHCAWMLARPDGDAAELAASLWDLEAWAARARRLRDRLAATRPDLDAGSAAALAPGFMLSAAVLRHLAADPLLPDAVLPRDWPGRELRERYAAWDRAYRDLLAQWHRGVLGEAP